MSTFDPNNDLLRRRMMKGSCIGDTFPKREAELIESAGMKFMKKLQSVETNKIEEARGIVTMSSKPVRECAKCHKDKPIIGRGMCGTCYHKARAAGEFKPGESVAPSVESIGDSLSSPLEKLLSPIPDLSMVLDFSEQPVLFQQLQDKGIDEPMVIELLSILIDGRLRQVLPQ